MELSTPEGASFQGFYKCHDLPAIVVIDPITGSNMRSFHGFQSAERFVQSNLDDKSSSSAARLLPWNVPNPCVYLSAFSIESSITKISMQYPCLMIQQLNSLKSA